MMRHGLMWLLICAWVLWEQFGGMGGPSAEVRWDIIGAFETRPTCQEQARTEEKRITDEKGKAKKAPPGSVVVPLRVMCLPGTVDPRPRS